MQDPSSGVESRPAKLAEVAVLPGWSALHSLHYETLANQQNMLEDMVRTSAYQRGMSANRADFEDRTVLDVGAGTGILSIFAAQAGARKVYAVEQTKMADHARRLVAHNGLSDRIEVICSALSDVTLPEKVDVIISEPWGFFLFHERMVEAFLTARDRFLRPDGKLFPATGRAWLAPFTEPDLYAARLRSAAFWRQSDYLGVDLSGLAETATKDIFSQPALGPVPPHLMMASPVAFNYDFRTMALDDLVEICMPFRFIAAHPGQINGLVGWFDLTFEGSTERVRLTTAPDAPRTHWLQLSFIFAEPAPVQIGQRFEGTFVLRANEQSSYTARLEAKLKGQALPAQEFHLHDNFGWSPMSRG